MKVSKLTITATIATGQYQNIQPSLEIVDIEDIDTATTLAMDYFKGLWTKYGTTPLRENKIVVKTSADKINELLD